MAQKLDEDEEVNIYLSDGKLLRIDRGVIERPRFESLPQGLVSLQRSIIAEVSHRLSYESRLTKDQHIQFTLVNEDRKSTISPVKNYNNEAKFHIPFPLLDALLQEFETKRPEDALGRIVLLYLTNGAHLERGISRDVEKAPSQYRTDFR